MVEIGPTDDILRNPQHPYTLGLLGSIVVGVASTAPAYSLAATLGLIVASGGSLLAGNLGGAVLVLVVQVVVGNPYLALGAFAVLALPGVPAESYTVSELAL